MISFEVKKLHLEPGMRVLDIGCGSGRHTAAIARAECHGRTRGRDDGGAIAGGIGATAGRDPVGCDDRIPSR